MWLWLVIGFVLVFDLGFVAGAWWCGSRRDRADDERDAWVNRSHYN